MDKWKAKREKKREIREQENDLFDGIEKRAHGKNWFLFIANQLEQNQQKLCKVH